MARVYDTSQAQIAFRVEGFEDSELLVNRYRGNEGVSQLYRFEIELVCSDRDLSFEAIVGKPAVLTVSTPYGDRWSHGIVSRFEHTGEAGDLTYFRAELVPSIWLLSHRYQSRIFQGKTVLQIVGEVLNRAGLPEDYWSKDLLQSTAYAEREFCVQYRETDFNFISRLLEEEGIYYCFDQTEAEHKMVLMDAMAAYPSIGEEATIPYHPLTALNAPEEHVFRFRYSQEVRPGAVALNDYNFKKPALGLLSKEHLERDGALEFSDCPGDYGTTETGQRLAKLRVEEFDAGRQLAIGQSSSHRLAIGRTFQMTEHPTTAFNREFLVTGIVVEGKQATHRSAGEVNADGSQRDTTAHRPTTRWLYHNGEVSTNAAGVALAQGVNPIEALASPNLLDDGPGFEMTVDTPTYECRFECVPSDIEYRPPRVTPRPHVRGTQTARVVGPQSEEIHTDEYGRVRVQFDWDREGSESGQPKLHGSESSCWIRVCQGMAGGAYGIMFIPRVGQEVIVDFLEGDPDRPIIVGRVYNADQMPPYELPANKTVSTIKTHSTKGDGGSNEIRFEDLKGKEQILIHAEKNLHVRAKSDRVESIGHNRHLTVHKDKFELVKENKSVEVTLDLNEKIGGNKLIAVAGDVGEEITGNHSESVTGQYYVVGKDLVIEGKSSVTIKAGGNYIKIDSSGIRILGKKVNVNCSGGSAGVGNAVALQEWEAPVAAATNVPGRDTRYDGAKSSMDGLATDDTQQDTSWIELELVNEAGQPVPGERYEIMDAGGEVLRSGSLDNNGQAHVGLPEPGTYNVCFPNLDADAWEGI